MKYTTWRCIWEWMYRSAIFTSALVEGEWSASLPRRFTPEKRAPVPTGWEAGWTTKPVWTARRRENSWLYQDSNSDPTVIHPLAGRYTDYAIPVPHCTSVLSFNNMHKYPRISFIYSILTTLHLRLQMLNCRVISEYRLEIYLERITYGLLRGTLLAIAWRKWTILLGT
jgi:hypothetical protein